MTVIVFDPTAFRAMFAPAFDSTAKYPDVLLQAHFDIATSIVTNQDNACYALNGAARVQALNLLVAHITKIFDMINAGQTPGFETSATIDKISVTVQPPPQASQFMWWLSLTGYGQMLATMLSVAAVGGDYIGGLPERSAIRKVAGIF